VTHPFHPLCGLDFEFVYRQNWGEDRVHLRDEGGQLFSLPAGWTDAAAADPFVVAAAGRAPFSTAGLLAPADLVDLRRAQRDGVEVATVMFGGRRQVVFSRLTKLSGARPGDAVSMSAAAPATSPASWPAL
jgi:Family of unknown function (DUF5372)